MDAEGGDQLIVNGNYIPITEVGKQYENREMHSSKACFLYSRKRIRKRRRIRKKEIGQTRPEQNLMKRIAGRRGKR